MAIHLPKKIPFWHILGLSIFSFAYLCTRSLTPTWIILLLAALCFVAAAFWFGNLTEVLFVGFIFSCSINLSKALIVNGGIYTPGLSVTLTDVFFLPLLFFWLADKLLIKREPIYWSNLHIFPLLFLLWSWASIAVSIDKLAGFFICLSLTKYFLMFVLLADYLETARHIRLVLYGFAAALCVHFSIALLEVVAGNLVFVQGAKTTTVGTSLVFEQAGGLHAFRPSGLMGHPNGLADLMTFVLPPLLILLLLGKKYMSPLAYCVMTVFFVCGSLTLLLTLSRAGWISFACAVFFVLYLGLRKGIIARRSIVFFFLVAVIAASMSALIFPTVYLRITQSDQRSSESRVAMMQQAKLIIERNPVLGVGIGGYNRAARENIPEYFAHLSPGFQEKLLKGVVHNKYLLVMSETGTIGIVLFVAMLLRFLLAAFRLKNGKNPILLLLTLGVSSGIFSQTVFYLFDHFYADSRLALAYIFFGLLAGLIKIQNESPSDSVGSLSIRGACV